MSYKNPDALVSTEWLAEHLDSPDVRVVDGSWYMPAMRRDARAEYTAQHIPGAVYFDIDDISDTSNPLPHMLPAPEKFSACVRRLGLGDGVRIVVYDGAGLFSAGRVWWMFRVFGHNDVAVLDGGLPKWLREDRPLETTAPMPRERHFTARHDSTLVRDIDQVIAAMGNGHEQIVDSRSAGRFTGTSPEPRPGMRGGHIPGSRNLPHDDMLDPDHGTVLPAEDLRALFADNGIDLARPIITTCGSGVTASAVALGLHLLGHKDFSVYDGSWSEWAEREDTPVET